MINFSSRVPYNQNEKNNRMKINVQKFKKEAIECIKAFHMEALLGIIFFILFNIVFRSENRDIDYLANVLSLAPSVLILTYACNNLFHGKYRFMYYLSAVSIVLLIANKELEESLLIKNYPYTILISLILLLICKWRRDNASFVRHVVECVSDIAASFLVNLILCLSYSAIISSFFYIFSLQEWLNYRYFSYFCSFSGFVVTPLVFYFLHNRKDLSWLLSKFMEGIINYIITPAILIYTVILYLYFITITVQWELPRGGVAYLVIAFIIAAMCGQMMQYVTKRRLYDWYYNRLSIISIPPLIIFWIGTTERISTYGLTESRVYLLATGILMSIYCLFFLFKSRNYQTIALLSIAILIILTYLPYVNAKNIALHSQIRHLEKYIVQLELRNPETGLLKAEISFMPNDSVNSKLYTDMRSSFKYIERIQGKELMEQRYGYTSYTLPKIEDPEIAITEKWTYFTINNYPESIDVKEYSQYYRFKDNKGNDIFQIDYNDQKTITVTNIKEQKEILHYPLAKQLELHPEWVEYADKREWSKIPLELFTARNQECLLIIRSFNYKNGEVASVYIESIFLK